MSNTAAVKSRWWIVMWLILLSAGAIAADYPALVDKDELPAQRRGAIVATVADGRADNAHFWVYSRLDPFGSERSNRHLINFAYRIGAPANTEITIEFALIGDVAGSDLQCTPGDISSLADTTTARIDGGLQAAAAAVQLGRGRSPNSPGTPNDAEVQGALADLGPAPAKVVTIRQTATEKRRRRARSRRKQGLPNHEWQLRLDALDEAVDSQTTGNIYRAYRLRTACNSARSGRYQ